MTQVVKGKMDRLGDTYIQAAEVKVWAFKVQEWAAQAP